MKRLQKSITNTISYKNVIKKFSKDHSYIVGMDISEKILIISAYLDEYKKTGIYISQNELKAREAYNEFSNYFPDETLYLSPKELLLYNVEAKSHENEYSRIRTLIRILKQDFKVVILPLRALADIICKPEKIIKDIFTVSLGMDFSINDMLETITEAGYKRETLVEGQGQFAKRGGIFDIFPINCKNPIRIEFFGDNVDSLRAFDPMSQRAVENIEKVEILPAREIILDHAEKRDLAEFLKSESRFMSYEVKIKVLEDIEKLEQNIYVNGIDKYLDHMAGDKKSILEYILADTIFIDEVDKFDDNFIAVTNETNEEIKNLFHAKKISTKMAKIINDLATTKILIDKFGRVYFSNVERKDFGTGTYFNSRSIPLVKGDISLLKENILEWIERGYSVNAVVSSEDKGKRLFDILNISEKIKILIGNISSGFELPDDKIVVISERNFLETRKRREFGYRGKNTQKISAFSDIKERDLIVHRVHGIGIYEGIEQLVIEKIKKDYIKIRYKDDGILYIPTEQLDAIQKYIGSNERKPKLNKLGSNDWSNTKRKVKESLLKLAEKLVDLYAKRQEINGYRYSADTPWQKEFEEKFQYEETEDQLICIDEIKRDMESEPPMDRILCGDVGYGKTEVAIRAIFKAVNDDFQSAYLVPTTVLAQQQYNSFVERFADYPINIEMLSRFRTPTQQREIIERIKRGSIDVLIATHRMLSKDISFKNLGLLVVDEEHRFGVEHKERIKEKHPSIDVLTLSATPIPRTLHMSMVGIRDISVIEMPPKERYPVQTYVMEHDLDIIRNAIYRELARKGQVFYIHNRVRDMDLKRDKLAKLIPEAKIEMSHGQMSERELERVMESFENKQIDILLCTTIIESGLDISNANTIIVENSQNFGLAQLYQLKGRVGRSDRHAYAYITYMKDKVLNENAEKRLNAIREFTEFGAGFKIALRDLEIRGAGNLLGPEQHGQMDIVGYEMYCRLLEEAVMDVRGMKPKIHAEEIRIDIKVSAYIDDKYISDIEQKIDMYKRIAEIKKEDDLQDVTDELMDRYGEIPQETMNLIEISYIKQLASEIGFVNIKQGKEEVFFTYGSTDKIDLQAISRLGEQFKDRVMFTPSANPYITFRCKGLNETGILENIKVVLQANNKLKCIS